MSVPSEKDSMMIQKATVYDLQKLLEKGTKETYTVDEIKALMDAYIEGVQQK